MLSAARFAANRENARHSTGPRTPEGKSASARNATKFGLFSASAVVRPEDKAEFDALARTLEAEYAPATATEQTFATEALHATWRIRRCMRLESALAAESIERALESVDLVLAAKQTSIDRARAQASASLRRAIKELRQLQTERILRAELQIEPSGAGLASFKQIVTVLAKDAKRRKAAPQPAPAPPPLGQQPPAPPQPSPPPPGDAFLGAFGDLLDKTNPSVNSVFTNRTQSRTPNFPRNAPCPCGSGRKFKRCCIAKAA